jgi:hypothetical protein
MQNFNHPSTSLASHSKPNFFLGEFYYVFPSLLAIENLQNLLFSIFPNFYFVLWRNFANKKKGRYELRSWTKETLDRSFKSANKLVELGLKWKNKPEDLWHIQQLEMQCGIHHHNPAQPHQSIQAPIAQQKQASGGHWHLVIAADALISLSCPIVPPTTTHFLTTQ